MEDSAAIGGGVPFEFVPTFAEAAPEADVIADLTRTLAVRFALLRPVRLRKRQWKRLRLQLRGVMDGVYRGQGRARRLEVFCVQDLSAGRLSSMHSGMVQVLPCAEWSALVAAPDGRRTAPPALMTASASRARGKARASASAQFLTGPRKPNTARASRERESAIRTPLRPNLFSYPRRRHGQMGEACGVALLQAPADAAGARHGAASAQESIARLQGALLIPEPFERCAAQLSEAMQPSFRLSRLFRVMSSSSTFVLETTLVVHCRRLLPLQEGTPREEYVKVLLTNLFGEAPPLPKPVRAPPKGKAAAASAANGAGDGVGTGDEGAATGADAEATQVDADGFADGSAPLAASGIAPPPSAGLTLAPEDNGPQQQPVATPPEEAQGEAGPLLSRTEGIAPGGERREVEPPAPTGTAAIGNGRELGAGNGDPPAEAAASAAARVAADRGAPEPSGPPAAAEAVDEAPAAEVGASPAGEGAGVAGGCTGGKGDDEARGALQSQPSPPDEMVGSSPLDDVKMVEASSGSGQVEQQQPAQNAAAAPPPPPAGSTR